MNNSVSIVWLEGIHPARLSELPGVSALLSQGVDVQLTPQPLVEMRQCYYQTITGMGAGKIGRFDAVRPENYRVQENTETPEGVVGHLLTDILQARKLRVASVEITGAQDLSSLAGQSYDAALIRVRQASNLDNASLDSLIKQCFEVVPSSHMVVLTDVNSDPVVAHVNTNDFLVEAGLMETGETKTINWTETLAYGSGTGQVWVNLRGRDAQGVVRAGKEYQEVLAALINELTTNWLDPQTNQPVVEHVYKKEEIYTGDYLFKAPDLTVVFRPGYAASEQAFALSLEGQSVQVANAAARDQAHAPYARMIASGPVFVRANALQVSLLDFVPTILYLLGQTIPQNVDGTVAEALFTEAYRTQTPVKRSENDADLLSDEEEGMIVDRLRDLGYLG